jgi:hypothetical protein
MGSVAGGQSTPVSRAPVAIHSLAVESATARGSSRDSANAEERLDRWVASEVDQERQLLVRFPSVVTVVTAALFAWLAFLIAI